MGAAARKPNFRPLARQARNLLSTQPFKCATYLGAILKFCVAVVCAAVTARRTNASARIFPAAPRGSDMPRQQGLQQGLMGAGRRRSVDRDDGAARRRWKSE